MLKKLKIKSILFGWINLECINNTGISAFFTSSKFQIQNFFLFLECVIIVHAMAGAFSAYLYSSKIKLKPHQLLSATSKQCFEQPATSFLACFLIFIEYKRKFLHTNRKSLQNRLLSDFEDLMNQNTYNLKIATPRIERFKFRRI